MNLDELGAKHIDIDKLEADELWKLYSEVHEKLIEKNEIRSKNITGDRGEQAAIDFYNNTPNLPKLQMAPPSTQNIDAISVKGDRYSIKTITFPNKTTGVFHGYGTPENPIYDKKFEYLIVVVLKSFKPIMIYEFSWEDFYTLKKWHSTMRAYNITLTKYALDKAKLQLKVNN